MQLNNFQSSNNLRLKQILHTLETVHGIKVNFDLTNPNVDNSLLEVQKTYEVLRDKLIKESAFNSYLQNAEYTKSILILEAVKIMLTEIAPKRRRKSRIAEMKADSDKNRTLPKVSTFADQLSDIAAKIPGNTEHGNAFSNALSSMADKMRFKEELDDNEKYILSWIRALPKPVSVSNLIRDGIEKFGPVLLDVRKDDIKKFKKIDKKLDDESESPVGETSAMTGPMKEGSKKDQDGDSDKDFADVMIARMIASGVPKAVAVAKTRKKSYNKESVLDESGSSNFTIDDIKKLEAISDLKTAKDFAKELISRPSARPMRKEKVVWFKHQIDNMPNVNRVVRVMYDLLLSGEGHGVVGTASSTAPSHYRKTVDKKPVQETVGDITGTNMPMAGIQDDTSATMATKTLTDIPHMNQAHHYEYQASMARSELYRNAKYAMSMMKQIDPHGEVQPWIAGALTKAANYLDKIYHYLDYYKKFEPEKLPEQMDSDMELGETSGGVTRQNLMMIMEYSIKLFEMIKPGEKLEGWVAMKLTTASECVSSCKHYLDYVQFEQHGLDDHFEAARRAKIKESRMDQLVLSEQEDLAKASTILAAKDMSSKVQSVAEDIAKMSVEDLMPLVDIMRGQFGSDAATAFNEIVKETLDALLDQATKTKETMDEAIDTLNKGGVPSQGSDIESAAEPAGEETPPADEEDAADLAADIGKLTAGEPAAPEPLGRAKKEELAEKWDAKMHTAKKDIGKWEGYTLSELKAKKDKLMKKEKRTAAEQKEVKQLNFAIRAKQKNKWGKVSEAKKENKFTCKKCGAPIKGESATCEKCAKKSHKKPHKVDESKSIAEKAPPGAAAERFITQNKDAFKKRYGKRVLEVLYATAWKKFGPKNESYDQTLTNLTVAKQNLNKLETEFVAHKKDFAQQLSENKVTDPLNLGYGLIGTNLTQQISKTKKQISTLKEQLNLIVIKGALNIMHEVYAVKNARKIEEVKRGTPYGVLYTASTGKPSKKLFETDAARNYWLKYQGNNITNIRLINPETFDSVINRTMKR